MTAPTFHDLPELIDGETATAWTWGDRVGASAFPAERSVKPERHEQKPPEKSWEAAQ